MKTVIAFVLLVVSSIHALGATDQPRTSAQVRAPRSSTEIVAHRGYNKLAPENTIASAQLCISRGVDWIEVDVRRTRDGVHVILHDDTLGRTTSGEGTVRDKLWDEIADLDAGSWFSPEFSAERIPRLDAFLDMFSGDIGIYLDVKEADLETVVRMISERGIEKSVFLYSSNRLLAQQISKLNSSIATKVNVKTPDDVARAATELGAEIVEFTPQTMSPSMIEACRHAGVRSMLYTKAPDYEAFERAVRLGIDMVNIDHPDVFTEAEREAVLGRVAMHAHNDYDHSTPLLDSLSAGADSIEADVFLVGGEVLVAHDLEDCVPERTLSGLYLEPLADLLGSDSELSDSVRHIILMIDLKQDSSALLNAIIDELSVLGPYLTVANDGSIAWGRVTVVLSGSVPREEVAAMDSRTVFLDGRVDDLRNDTDPSLVPVVSERWTSMFGPGLPAPGSPQDARLSRFVKTAHDQGRLVRFWAAPDTSESWLYQHQAGVDLINTDYPQRFSLFAEKQSQTASVPVETP